MTIEPVVPGSASLDAAAQLFDGYRVHYGAEAVPHRSAAWLGEQIMAGRLFAWMARDRDLYVGGVVVAPLPASIVLGVN
jgi:hypothetical protein